MDRKPARPRIPYGELTAEQLKAWFSELKKYESALQKWDDQLKSIEHSLSEWEDVLIEHENEIDPDGAALNEAIAECQEHVASLDKEEIAHLFRGWTAPSVRMLSPEAEKEVEWLENLYSRVDVRK